MHIKIAFKIPCKIDVLFRVIRECFLIMIFIESALQVESNLLRAGVYS